MNTLRLLGTCELVDTDGAADSAIPASAKRIALLTWLVLRHPYGLHRRDLLLALFWPESTQERARSSLRTALHALRRSLGPTAIDTRGDEVGITRDQLWCDVIAFEEACAEGRLEEALELYRGDLLPGLHLPEAEDLEDWLSLRRNGLRQSAVDAAWALSARAERDDDEAAAVRWARRAVELAPTDEAAFRRLLEALDAYGRFDDAVRAYRDLLQRRNHAGDEPEPETSRVAAAIQARQTKHRSQRPTASAPAEHVSLADPAVMNAPYARVSAGPQRTSAFHVWFRANRRLALAGVAIAVAALFTAGAARLHQTLTPDEGAAPDAIAVLPFRVHSAAAEFGYLSEGIVDLISMELTGEVGARSLDPQRVLPAWEEWSRRRSEGNEAAPENAARFARGLGAGRVIIGDVVGDRGMLVFQAALLSAADGTAIARVRAAGPADSLAQLLNKLAGGVLYAAGVQRSARFGDAPVQMVVLRAHLKAEAHYRRGDYAQAADFYEEALEADSTYVPAAFGLILASRWGTRDDRVHRAWRLLEKSATQLSRSERALLYAVTGLPGGFIPTVNRQLNAWEDALDARPNDAQIWYEFADLLVHWGDVLGRPDSRRAATSAFNRALELRPNFAPAISHLISIYAADGNLPAARRLLQRTSLDASTRDFSEWLVATAADDEQDLEALRARFSEMSTESLVRIAGAGQIHVRGLSDSRDAAKILASRAHAPADVVNLYRFLAFLALNRGDRAEALRLNQAMKPYEIVAGESERSAVLAALYGGGDERSAEAAYQRVDGRGRKATNRDPHYGAEQLDLCVAEQWRVAHGDTTRLASTIELLTGFVGAPDSAVTPGQTPLADRVCREMLLAVQAVARQSDARPAVARFDSVRTAAVVAPDVFTYDRLVIARLWAQVGDIDAALAAIRRRPDHHFFTPRYLAGYLREEGRLAAAAGDTAGAIRAYRHYLALRADPDPPLRAEADRIRRELAALETR